MPGTITKNLGYLLILVGLLLLFTAIARSAPVSNPLDVCRVRVGESKLWCTHYRGGVVKERRERSVKTIDGWVAVPCKQLKKRLPGISCKKTLGEHKLGEAIDDSK